MGERRINVERLNALIGLILEEPRRLMMETFAGEAVELVEEPDERPPCGTVMCVAGTAMLAAERERGFYRKRFDDRFIVKLNLRAEDEAAQWLGLDYGQSKRLFYFKNWRGLSDGRGWPENFSNAYKRAKTPQERAEVTAERIRYFIATNGAE